jgi:hypothetical protein
MVVKNGTELQAAVTRSIEMGERTLELHGDVAYYFDEGESLVIADAVDWALVARGRTELFFTMTNGSRTGGVVLLRCERVQIVGLTLDFDPPPFYQGTLI